MQRYLTLIYRDAAGSIHGHEIQVNSPPGKKISNDQREEIFAQFREEVTSGRDAKLMIDGPQEPLIILSGRTKVLWQK